MPAHLPPGAGVPDPGAGIPAPLPPQSLSFGPGVTAPPPRRLRGEVPRAAEGDGLRAGVGTGPSPVVEVPHFL